MGYLDVLSLIGWLITNYFLSKNFFFSFLCGKKNDKILKWRKKIDRPSKWESLSCPRKTVVANSLANRENSFQSIFFFKLLTFNFLHRTSRVYLSVIIVFLFLGFFRNFSQFFCWQNFSIWKLESCKSAFWNFFLKKFLNSLIIDCNLMKFYGKH